MKDKIRQILEEASITREDFGETTDKILALVDVGGNEVALCQCSEDETTGWIELKCCNICGKPQEQLPSNAAAKTRD